jgi:hypothetical protein
MSEPRPLHRLFGLSWIDFFQGSPVGVETGLDLSLKQQFVDVVLIRKGPGPVPRRLPDGSEELAAHNLVTLICTGALSAALPGDQHAPVRAVQGVQRGPYHGRQAEGIRSAKH